MKKQKWKKVEVIQLESKVPLTSEANLELNILAKIFSYPQFMDKELMTPVCLEQLWGDEDDLEEKFQWPHALEVGSNSTIFRVNDFLRHPSSQGSRGFEGKNNFVSKGTKNLGANKVGSTL